jgi:hypothetical protein
MFNFVGGLLFLWAGIAGIIGVEDENLAMFMIDFTYLLGSSAYLIGGILALHLWKGENYGLGMLSEMNVKRENEVKMDIIMKAQAQYGCGRASAWQMPWLVLYILNVCACTVSLGLAFSYKQKDDEVGPILNSSLQILLSHGFICLGSVMHHTPKAQPHKCIM